MEKDANNTPSIVRFFRLFTEQFWYLQRANLLYILFFVPLAAISFFAFALMNVSEGMLFGDFILSVAEFNEVTHFGLVVSLFISTIPLIFISLANAGITLINRNIVREKPFFIVSDFFRAIKENWKQSLAAGFLVQLFLVVLAYSIPTYADMSQDKGGLFYVPLALLAILAAVIIFSSYFAYMMIVSFNLKFSAIVKNSAAIAIGALPSSILMFVVDAVFFISCFVWFFLLQSISIGGAFILLSIYLFIGLPFSNFTKSFLMWPVIEKITKASEAAQAAQTAQETQPAAIPEVAEPQADEPVSPTADEAEEEEEDDYNSSIEDGDELVFYQGRMVKRSEIEFL